MRLSVELCLGGLDLLVILLQSSEVLPSLGDGRGVGEHADSTGNLGQVTGGHQVGLTEAGLVLQRAARERQREGQRQATAAIDSENCGINS